eukprot:m.199131 g.199131  ORF g.199131 m.199131 type:complete len:460 (-) comp17679_c0_seq10:1840-3219(-)
MASADLECKLKEVESLFKLEKPRLQKMIEQMQEEMRIGLQKADQQLLMIPTFVRHLPRGDEKGTYLAVDMGGSTFRVLRLELDGSRKIDLSSKSYVLTKEHRESDADTLFGFIADCLEEFFPEVKTASKPIPLGFTFSFPFNCTRINQGTLVRWTKGFSAKNCVGEDAVKLLQNACDKKGVRISVKAILNDTVGTMAARALEWPDCFVGLILGTGTNACYYERIENITKANFNDTGNMVVNIEWGAFGDGKSSVDGPSVLPWTKYDQGLALDPPENKQLYEKMISGRYQGEIVRQVLVELIEQGLLLGGKLSQELSEQWRFETKNMSMVEGDSSAELDVSKEVLTHLGYPNNTLAERQALLRVCHAVSKRAARLTAFGIVAILRQMGDRVKESCTIAVDGSVFQKHPTFQTYLNEAVDELRDGQFGKVNFALAENGSGQGAGLVAAAVCSSGSDTDGSV